MFELWRGEEGDVSECAHSSAEVLSLKNEMPCFSTISLQLLRAYAYVTLIVSATCAKYLLFPGTFYRQALVPQPLFVSV